MKLRVAVAVLALAGCGLLKKKTPPDAGAVVDAGVLDDGGSDAGAAGTDDDAGTTTDSTAAPTATMPVSQPGGPFQGTYKCGSLWGEMKVSQQGDHVTASHMEGKGAVAYVAQCVATGTKCVGTYRSTDTKTMKPKAGGTVTISTTPKGDITYKGGTQPATTCKKQP